MRKRRLALTGLLNLAAQALLLGALYVWAADRPLAVGDGWRDVILATLAFAQSAIWVIFFYLQDRAEPEPTGYVLLAFGAGMAAASLVSIPFEHVIFNLPAWMYRSETSLVLGAACVRGALFALLVYGIVHFGFEPSAEFDEPADGMAYGAFIGCGLAAVTSLVYLAAHPDFTLFAAAVAAAGNVLVYASVGALVGYLVGSTKFAARPSVLASPVAILGGAALVGLYSVIVESAVVTGASHPLWAGAGAAMVFAAVVLGAATILMHRLTTRTTPPQGHAVRRIEPLAVVAGLVLLATGAGAADRGLRPVAFHDDRYAIGFAYDPTIATPAVGSGESGGITQAAFATSETQGLRVLFSARTRDGATVTVQARPGALNLDQFVAEPFLLAADPIGLRMTEITIGGRRGLRLRYAYQLQPQGMSLDLPRLRWAYTDVVPSATHAYAISFDAEPGAFAAGEAFYQRLLSTVTWTGQ